jgi:hypothetical protein
MYFIIEYVDTVAGIEGEALTWEFAKTEGSHHQSQGPSPSF